MVPFFNIYYDDEFTPITSDDQIDKILDNYEKTFIENYEFWRDLVDKHINTPYASIVNKMLTIVNRLDLEDVLFKKVTYDQFCVSFLDYLRVTMFETKMFGSFVLVSVFNQIISSNILNNISDEDLYIWEQYYNNINSGNEQFIED